MDEERGDEVFEPSPDDIEVIYDEPEGEAGEAGSEAPRAEKKVPAEDYDDLNDRYLRLYAEFENYRKRASREKEELLKYSNESLLYELLPSLDNLEIALQHAGNDNQSGLVEGVGMTLREFYRTLEKFGLKPIEAKGKPFDPQYHHAVAQVENDEVEDKTVVEELRKGFMYRDKVLRASMVAVSRRPEGKGWAGQGPEKDES